MADDTRYRDLIDDGLQASREGRIGHAIDCFARAAQEQPASGVPHFLLGSEHAAAGDVLAAERSLASAVLLAPDFHLARYQLGLLQFSFDRPAAALVTWQPLLDAGGDESLGQFVRGFGALAGDDVAQALSHFRSGLARAGVQPAVAADVQKVVDALERLAAPSADQGMPDVQHVLLSAYARGLH